MAWYSTTTSACAMAMSACSRTKGSDGAGALWCTASTRTRVRQQCIGRARDDEHARELAERGRECEVPCAVTDKREIGRIPLCVVASPPCMGGRASALIRQGGSTHHGGANAVGASRRTAKAHLRYYPADVRVCWTNTACSVRVVAVVPNDPTRQRGRWSRRTRPKQLTSRRKEAAAWSKHRAARPKDRTARQTDTAPA